MSSPSRHTRRRVLAGLAAVTGSGVFAGCLTGDSADDRDPTDGSTGRDTTPGDGGSGPESPGGSDGTGPDDGSRADTADCAGASVHEGYAETRVSVTTPDGETLGSVTAAVADTGETRRTGLSETACLPPDRGMLFVYGDPQPLNFWMIDMSFGLDIVYVDDEGVITSIHHAGAPEPGESGTEEHHQYPGTGQYVLEVNEHWTTERSVEAGDVVRFDR